MYRAFDYSDVVLGTSAVRFCAHFICRHHWSTWTPPRRCNSMFLSSLWDRKFQDALATRQARYCKNCGVRYKTSFGMIVELVVPQPDGMVHSLYAKAAIPSPEMWEVLTLALECRQPNLRTGEELLEQCPIFHPVSAAVFKRTAQDGAGPVPG